MNSVIAQALADDPYEALPRAVKDLYTREQWLWLSDNEKATLVQRETECEYDG
jgi:hypothetical protein